ncbi:MAG: M3 family metallopeptidase [Aestuariibacter sp.]
MKSKRFALSALALALSLAGCSPANQTATETTADSHPAVAAEQQTTENPFFSEWATPYGVAPFDKIKEEHYLPAFEKAIAEQQAEVLAIVENTETPTFENTIVALEKAGALLSRVSTVFYALRGTDSNDKINEIAKEISPKLSATNDDILLNEGLFTKIKTVYDNRSAMTLRPDQAKLLEDTYKDFVRGGANLNDDDKSKLRELNEKLSNLSLQFGENLLNETNAFELVIEKEEDLAGLPNGIVAAAAKTAEERGHAGKWVFTTHRPSKNPFLTYSERRDLREKIYHAYTHRGDNDNASDNKAIASEMASLRVKRAQLLGYESHAHYVLENATAKTPENVYNLLNQIWPAGLAKAKEELAMMQELADQEGADFKVAAWDWWYYAEKIRKAKYDLDAEASKPYFELRNTLEGVFYAANRLWGVTFKERDDIPKYHPEVMTFEVFDHDGSQVGVYMYDPYVRASKRGGAWMNSFRKQHRMNGEDVLPIIYNVTNFPSPVGDEPSLLTFSQAETLFHEFGHAIQGLLSDGYYRSQTGTALPRDYVEYPSQVMENWMYETDVLNHFAKHYKTGEVIPQKMVEKILAAGKFNQGFGTTEYLSAALLDMKWHTLTDAEIREADAFETAAMEEIGLIEEIAPRYRSTYFSHIFAGGYASGYYGYIWSNIYDADTWKLFTEKGVFDKDTAEAYRKWVLETGGTGDPAEMYRKFRGQDPDISALLERRGLAD